MVNRKLENFQLENGLNVPAFGGRLFCSRRDPIKESEIWFQKNEMSIRSAQKILILGLGAGFHLLNFEPKQEIYVLELDSGLIDIFMQRDLPTRPRIQFIKPDSEIEATVLEFRPAWLGMEAEYERASRFFRKADRSSLQKEAERKDLWILTEALKNSSLPENLEITIKDIASTFALENQTPEAKIWRALRELVA